MKKEEIVNLLKDYNSEDVEKFAAYCIKLLLEKNRKNFWMQKKTSEQMAGLFKRVARDGLKFDGEHITLQSTGISYDYIAYKNKMILAYPESVVDVQLVNEGDDFKVAKESGNVIYSHTMANPFGDEKIVGGYCIIKNKRGEFLTLLSKEEIDKHRKVAKTDYIWKAWFREMALKTVIKKACKQHFADIYVNIEANDNENYNLENPLGIGLEEKQAIEAIETLEELKDYYQANKGKGKNFDNLISLRKKQINENL